mgnify:CR=1 FL=1
MADVKFYTPLEERLNIASHAMGLVLSLLGLVLLLLRAIPYGNALNTVSVAIYGASMIALYAASTAYHSSTKPDIRRRLRVVDHASIYVLISGTYTPFMLITLKGAIGWTLFAITWGMALTGITLKLFFTGRFNLLSTLMYVFMGWLIIFAIKPMIAAMPPGGMIWLVAGGLAYTFGALLYAIKSIPYNHAIFHLFVLAGSICHFIAVYEYVLPRN